jgi:hypothetical protein
MDRGVEPMQRQRRQVQHHRAHARNSDLPLAPHFPFDVAARARLRPSMIAGPVDR